MSALSVTVTEPSRLCPLKTWQPCDCQDTLSFWSSLFLMANTRMISTQTKIIHVSAIAQNILNISIGFGHQMALSRYRAPVWCFLYIDAFQGWEVLLCVKRKLTIILWGSTSLVLTANHKMLSDTTL